MKQITILITTLLLFTASVAAQPYGQGRGKGRMWEQLNLTPEQKTKLETMRDKFQKDMIDLRAGLQKARLDVQQLMKDGTFDRAKILGAQENALKQEAALRKAQLNHRLDMLAVLDNTQRQQAADMWKGGIRQGRGKGNCDCDGPHGRRGGRGPKGRCMR